MRQLYLTLVRPIITYGCATWFLRGPDVKWRLSDKLLSELESRQYQCLVQIAGAYKQIPRQYLLKELCIEPLEVHLERCAMAFRARAFGPNTPRDQLQNWSPSVGKLRSPKPELLQQHPYYVLDLQARQIHDIAQKRLGDGNKKDWEKQKVRAKAINTCAREMAEWQASEIWRTWRTERQTDRRKDQPALWSAWGMENLNLYKGLRREQSTILLQCRTGVGGLRAHLFHCKVCSLGRWAFADQTNFLSHQVADSDKCDCGEKHTAEHLFCHCPKLRAASSVLRQAVNHTDFRRLMTVDVKEATDWAICFFGLPQFEWTRWNMRNKFTEDMSQLSLDSHEEICRGSLGPLSHGVTEGHPAPLYVA